MREREREIEIEIERERGGGGERDKHVETEYTTYQPNISVLSLILPKDYVHCLSRTHFCLILAIN